MRAWLRVGRAVVSRPTLWPTACRLGLRMVPSGWWKRFPFVPLPPREYVAFRLVTQYGSEGASIEPADVLNYLAWCKRQW